MIYKHYLWISLAVVISIWGVKCNTTVSASSEATGSSSNSDTASSSDITEGTAKQSESAEDIQEISTVSEIIESGATTETDDGEGLTETDVVDENGEEMDEEDEDELTTAYVEVTEKSVTGKGGKRKSSVKKRVKARKSGQKPIWAGARPYVVLLLYFATVLCL